MSKRDGERLGFPVFPILWENLTTGEKYDGYKEFGFLPDSFINMLVFLGWNPGNEKEIFDLDELVQAFSLERIGNLVQNLISKKQNGSIKNILENYPKI